MLEIQVPATAEYHNPDSWRGGGRSSSGLQSPSHINLNFQPLVPPTRTRRHLRFSAGCIIGERGKEEEMAEILGMPPAGTVTQRWIPMCFHQLLPRALAVQ